MTEEQKSLQWLSSILDILRRDCPWDSVQTIESLRYLTIEEVYELSEAIISGNFSEMRKELGDIFMHLLFYSKIADDAGQFNTADVIDGICTKLVSRHPHIALPDRDGVMQQARQSSTPDWEKVKFKEGRHFTLEGVPASLPPLVKAVRMQEKAAGMGFEFPDTRQAKEKVDEEYGEFIEALCQMHDNPNEATHSHAEEELGDLLFAIVKWARFEGINADDALCRANKKFYDRFSYVERHANADGHSVSELSLKEMEALWDEAKHLEHESIENNIK